VRFAGEPGNSSTGCGSFDANIAYFWEGAKRSACEGM